MAEVARVRVQRELEYAFSVWTINQLGKHLAKQTGILLSYTRFRALLSKHNYVYRQPKHERFAGRDSQGGCRRVALVVEKSPSVTIPLILLFVDETNVSLPPVLHRCWMKRGQRKTIPAPGTPQYIHSLGVYYWRDAHGSCLTRDRKHNDSFIDFIQSIMHGQYPHGKVVMVLDNVSYHRSKASLAALSVFEERLHVVWLPTYCPFLNTIERFWLHLKTLAVANHLHPGTAALITALEDTISHHNQPDHLDRLDFAKHFPLSA
ncbi:MAG: IS630 family transposase [Chloroflexi bacterium]|nr:IS630 family transposase [Chloroflexota bacterium]